MSTALWRVQTPSGIMLARGDSDTGPDVLLDATLTVASLLGTDEPLLDQLTALNPTGVVPADARILAPTDEQPVWAAGVTYPRSRDARKEESSDDGDVYDRVFTAPRPELFFKSAPDAVIGTGDQLGIRADSDWNVPEPELGILADASGSARALVLGNDMSSRSIEGDNPLYLPQAKVYERSCGLGPCLVPITAVAPWESLQIQLSIVRRNITLFSDSVHLAAMHRTPKELLTWLFSASNFPHGVVLLTGTSLVPPAHLSVLEGDIITIRSIGLGTLTNSVTTVGRRITQAHRHD